MNDFEETPIESVRNYWDARPCNIRHSSAPLGTPEYFAEVRRRKYFVEPHIIDFAGFGRWRGRRVLEVGCGIGTDMESFCLAGVDYTGIDLSPVSLEIAKSRALLLPPSAQPELRVHNIERPLPQDWDDTFDLVYSFGVLHHTPYPSLALQNIRRVVKVGGELRIMLYHRASYKTLQITKGRLWNIDRRIANESEAQFGCPVTYTYTRQSAEQLLRNTGFDVIDMHIEHIFPYKIKDYVEYRYVRTIPATVLQPVWPWLESKFGWHLLIRARRSS